MPPRKPKFDPLDDSPSPRAAQPKARTSTLGEGQRIAKLLARAGIASRREIERMIEGGRVARDGVAITTPATVLTSLNGITVDGKPVKEPHPPNCGASTSLPVC